MWVYLIKKFKSYSFIYCIFWAVILLHSVIVRNWDLQYFKVVTPLPLSSSWWCFKAFTHLILCHFRVYHSRKFSKCSIAEYKEFLLRGGGACLFNRPTKVINKLVIRISATRNENVIISLTSCVLKFIQISMWVFSWAVQPLSILK